MTRERLKFISYLNKSIFDSKLEPVVVTFAQQLGNVFNDGHGVRQSWDEVVQYKVVRSIASWIIYICLCFEKWKLCVLMSNLQIAKSYALCEWPFKKNFFSSRLLGINRLFFEPLFPALFIIQTTSLITLDVYGWRKKLSSQDFSESVFEIIIRTVEAFGSYTYYKTISFKIDKQFIFWQLFKWPSLFLKCFLQNNVRRNPNLGLFFRLFTTNKCETVGHESLFKITRPGLMPNKVFGNFVNENDYPAILYKMNETILAGFCTLWKLLSGARKNNSS